MSNDCQSRFSYQYSENLFWDKLQKYARSAGIKVIYAGLLLYYALRESKTPSWAKGVIIGTLGYFISPLDAIPDVLAVAGYTDDLGVLVLALATVAMYIDSDVKVKVREKIRVWFPNAAEEEFSDIVLCTWQG